MGGCAGGRANRAFYSDALVKQFPAAGGELNFLEANFAGAA